MHEIVTSSVGCLCFTCKTKHLYKVSIVRKVTRIIQGLTWVGQDISQRPQPGVQFILHVPVHAPKADVLGFICRCGSWNIISCQDATQIVAVHRGRKRLSSPECSCSFHVDIVPAVVALFQLSVLQWWKVDHWQKWIGYNSWMPDHQRCARKLHCRTGLSVAAADVIPPPLTGWVTFRNFIPVEMICQRWWLWMAYKSWRLPWTEVYNSCLHLPAGPGSSPAVKGFVICQGQIIIGKKGRNWGPMESFPCGELL